MMKWLTSGSHRLKANLSRSFGARKTKKAAAGKKDVGYKGYLKSTRLRIIRKDITRMERRKEESNRLSHTHDVQQPRFRNDLFSADSIEQILALQELHRQREFEQPQENRICCEDVQLADGSVHSNKMPSTHNQCMRRTRDAYTTHQLLGIDLHTGKEQEAQLRDSFTPVTKNSHYQSQPQQQTLRFFNKGFEVDGNGIPLSAGLS